MILNRKIILQGLGHPLLGDGGTGEPVAAQALGVDDVLARLHRHVLAHLARVACWQLGNVKYSDEKGGLVMKENGIKSQKTSLVAPGAEKFSGKVSNRGCTLYQEGANSRNEDSREGRSS